ncbi:MAG: hypothetical protein HIU93_16060 [Acidobacteria bacterium]|nr:hypothetical protein [Acidobacteriota bacterium]
MSKQQVSGSLIRLSRGFVAAVACVVCLHQGPSQALGQEHDAEARAWMRKVRIAAYPLSAENANAIVAQAAKDSVYGIEIDNDIPGRYESLLDPTAKLQAIHAVSTAAHRANNKTFVYIAGLECISANDSSPHTLAKDHPEWLQRKLSGQPAIFGTKSAFWIAKGEEDVWVSPYAADWRKLYMKRVAQIAGTGVDGIYVDIPYWMTHFTGWEDSWASFDDSTVAAFKQKTGLDARKDIKLGDFDDPGFQQWVDFRIHTITDFLAEIRSTAVAVNPNISIIPEIYPGIESEGPRVGSDVYEIYPVVDAIAHEYEFGGGDDHTAAMRAPFDWMMYQIGMRSFRAFAGSKPTWMLNYSWDGAAHVKPSDAMQTLANSELMAGANVWDARGHVMSGSNDIAERRTIYAWIGEHEDVFGKERQQLGDIGVYFSDATRNRYTDKFINSYRGALLLMLQTHRQFQIVTPRTLEAFTGKTLVLPNVQVLDAQEITLIHRFAANGGHLVIDGDSNSGLTDLTHATRLPDDPAQKYLKKAENNYADAKPDEQTDFLNALGPANDDAIQVKAGSDVVAHAMRIDGKTYLFFANFTGIKPGVELTPATQKLVTVIMPTTSGTIMHVLPFLGTPTVVKGTRVKGGVSYVLPPMTRGAVVWFQ